LSSFLFVTIIILYLTFSYYNHFIYSFVVYVFIILLKKRKEILNSDIYYWKMGFWLVLEFGSLKGEVYLKIDKNYYTNKYWIECYWELVLFLWKNIDVLFVKNSLFVIRWHDVMIIVGLQRSSLNSKCDEILLILNLN